MKKLLTAAAILVSATAATTNAVAADKYIFDVTHTNLIWHAGHMGFSNPNGQFAKVEGFVVLDKENPSASKTEATIDIKSLWTPTEKFTAHLLGADFFNADKNPTAKFVSTKVEPAADNKSAKVTGDLTVNGVTKPVVLDVVLNKIAPNPMSNKETAGFSATTTLKRSEFGINYAIPNVTDEVKISIELEAVIEQAADAAKE